MPPVKGGAVQTLLQLFCDWNEREKKHKITVFSTYNDKAVNLAKNYSHTEYCYIYGKNSIRWYPYRLVKKIMLLLSVELPSPYMFILRRTIKKQVYDIVLFENVLCNAKWFLGKSACPVILHLHNDYVTQKTKKYLNSFSKVIAVSKFIENRIQSVGYAKTEVLYNGIEQGRFLIRKDYQQKENIIVFSGRLVPEKGVKELIDACLRIEDIKFKLMIMGKLQGKYGLELQKLAKDSDKIEFTGYIDNNKIQDILSRTTIAVIPSLWEEPFPLSAIEFIAAGIPVIATNSGGLTELLSDDCAIFLERNAFLIENLKNAIKNLLLDKTKREEMSKAALDRAKLFTDEIYCRNFNNILENFVNGKHI